MDDVCFSFAAQVATWVQENTILKVLVLAAIFQIKHFFADYPLQNSYMLGKFKPGLGFVVPLAAHCGVHSAMTLGIALYFNPFMALPLALFDFAAHFAMDRIKASPKLLGRYKALSAKEYVQVQESLYISKFEKFSPQAVDSKINDLAKIRGNKLFWWALGLDQMVHHLTHYVIIFFLV